MKYTTRSALLFGLAAPYLASLAACSDDSPVSSLEPAPAVAALAAVKPPPRSCPELEQAAKALYARSAAGCTLDADCRAISLPGGCPDALACSVYVSVATDLEALKGEALALSNEHRDAQCGCTRPVAECRDPGVPVCRDQRCQRSR